MVRGRVVLAMGLVVSGCLLVWGAYRQLPVGDASDGSVVVYVQTAQGPVVLQPRLAHLPRPQHIAFLVRLSQAGQVRFRVELWPPEPGRFSPSILHEEVIEGPTEDGTTEVLKLGEASPDRFVLKVRLTGRSGQIWQQAYPLHLATEAHRFWAGESPD